MGEDEILWSIRWSPALVPELSMIPDRSVFLCASQGLSLTATDEGIAALLPPFPNSESTVLDGPSLCGSERITKCIREREML